jgi:hypothetical protein
MADPKIRAFSLEYVSHYVAIDAGFSARGDESSGYSY